MVPHLEWQWHCKFTLGHFWNPH